MKAKRAILFSVALGLVGCGGGEATKPEATSEADSAPSAAQTSGLDQQGPQGAMGMDSDAASAHMDMGGSGRAKMGCAAPVVDDNRRVHFAYDSDSVDGEMRALVEANARYLAANPRMRVSVEGHADERGTREYNLALGERRAQAVERMMRVLGVSGDRVSTVSYGEEKPVVCEQNESAWRMNRRVEFIYKQ